jgi:NAD(P)-dependent dehydrogenase (short-subunit alcohol dehydrogenase family)
MGSQPSVLFVHGAFANTSSWAKDNAGTEGKPGPLIDQTADSYAAIFDTNVLGVILSMKHELRVMLARKQGSIINLSSVLGHPGAPGYALYTASKHAVEGLSKSAALEVAGSGVRINTVSPGPIDTAMLARLGPEGRAAFVATVPQQRPGKAEEIADAIVFLASDKASFITGASLAVDGGATA